MIIQENLGNGLIRTYSNLGVKVHGGYPEADYDVAYDPEDSNREYTETNIPVESKPLPEKGHRSISKVNLYDNLVKLGIWDQVEAYMKQSGVWPYFDYATTLDEDSDLIKNAILALKSSLGLSDEDVENLIANSIVR